MSNSETEQVSSVGRDGGRPAEDEDELAVRNAVSTMNPVTPEWTGLRTIAVTPLGCVTLQVDWVEDPEPPAPDAVKHWETEARRLHKSGECAYWDCTVTAACGDLEAEAGLGLIQIADGGGDDAEQIERELAEEAILDLLGQREEAEYMADPARAALAADGAAGIDASVSVKGERIPVRLESTKFHWPYPSTRVAGRGAWGETWLVLAHASGLVGQGDYRASIRAGRDNRRARMRKAIREAMADLRGKILARLGGK